LLFFFFFFFFFSNIFDDIETLRSEVVDVDVDVIAVFFYVLLSRVFLYYVCRIP